MRDVRRADFWVASSLVAGRPLEAESSACWFVKERRLRVGVPLLEKTRGSATVSIARQNFCTIGFSSKNGHCHFLWTVLGRTSLADVYMGMYAHGHAKRSSVSGQHVDHAVGSQCGGVPGPSMFHGQSNRGGRYWGPASWVRFLHGPHVAWPAPARRNLLGKHRHCWSELWGPRSGGGWGGLFGAEQASG